jgi:hypothetical protein
MRYPSGELRHAWKTLIQNHPHDSICGCSIDAVHEENMTRFARARQVGDAIVESSLMAIADSVEPAGAGSLRVIAVNPDAVEGARMVEAFIDLPFNSAEPWRTVDPEILDRPVTFWPRGSGITRVTAVGGGDVPFQVLGEADVIAHEMSRFETPWALHATRVHLLFLAPSLPSCGYAAFDLTIADTFAAGRPAATGAGVAATERSAENERLRLTVNDDGTIDVAEKATGAEFRGVALLDDSGDVGDEYNYCPPSTDRLLTSADAGPIRVARVHAGPLRATFRIDLELQLPATATADRQGRDAKTVAVPVSIDATLDAGSPRINLAVTVDNAARDHRLRMLFPTGADRVAAARADTAFDIVSRPARREVPATIRNEAPVSSAPMISVVDAGDDRRGATVIGKGLMEYEMVPGDGSSSIALTLIRAVGDLSRNDLATRPSGHAGPSVATPAAQCIGRYHFDMAFEPRGASPAPGSLFASARSVTVPPLVAAARKHGGSAPATRSFLRVDRKSGEAVLSALKKAEDRDSIIVRLFNPGETDAAVALTPDFAVTQAFGVNFLEAREHPLTIVSGTASLCLKPHQIQTIELTL